MFSVDSWTCSGQTTRCSSIISRTFGYNDENGIQFGIVFNLGGQPSYLWHINIAQQFVWILNWRKKCWWMFWHSSELRGLCLMKWLSKAPQKLTILLKYESPYNHFRFLFFANFFANKCNIDYIGHLLRKKNSMQKRGKMHGFLDY